MPFEEIRRVKVENADVIAAFNRLQDIEADCESEEQLQCERVSTWGVLWAAYPDLAISDDIYYEYNTNEVVIMKNITITKMKGASR